MIEVRPTALPPFLTLTRPMSDLNFQSDGTVLSDYFTLHRPVYADE